MNSKERAHEDRNRASQRGPRSRSGRHRRLGPPGRGGRLLSLGTIDRIAYPNYESLVSLAAAAAVTERIGLVTDILIAPLRTNSTLFAKQAATIDNLSGGRLTLGLAVGGRPDDYEVSGV